MADADFHIKAHDRLPSIQAALTTNGGPVDLTDAVAVTFIMRATQGAEPKINDAAVIVAPATGGVVRYDWQATDTDAVGTYQAEWQVEWPGGHQTFPTLTYHTIAVLADLDNA